MRDATTAERLECDLVIKGGVMRDGVYPRLVADVARATGSC
jgi:hypothetical protein